MGVNRKVMSEQYPEMARMWAPWRMEYIGAPKEAGCFLCRIGEERERDVGNLVLWRGNKTFLVMNRYPYNGGHVMAVPYRHVASVPELDGEEWGEVLTGIRRAEAALTAVMRPQGFNIGVNQGGAAGAGAKDHAHVHVVPRWEGDANFLPVLGSVRVVPQALETTAAALRKALRELGAEGVPPEEAGR